jgi:hypothetical protein
MEAIDIVSTPSADEVGNARGGVRSPFVDVPLVRYQVGDAITGPAMTGHGHVAGFDAIAGRLNDVIVLGPGDAIHSVAVFHCVHQENVHNIQMVLRDDGIDLCLVSAERDRAAMESRIRARLAQVHPALGGVRFQYREDLETSLAGKRRWFVDHRTRRVNVS